MYKHLLTTGLLAAMTVGSAASAESYFACMGPIPQQGVLELGSITSDGDGTVDVYDYRLGEQGNLLGSIDVQEGANMDVRLNVGNAPLGDLLATLTVDGQVVATNVYRLCDD